MSLVVWVVDIPNLVVTLVLTLAVPTLFQGIVVPEISVVVQVSFVGIVVSVAIQALCIGLVPWHSVAMGVVVFVVLGLLVLGPESVVAGFVRFPPVLVQVVAGARTVAF